MVNVKSLSRVGRHMSGRLDESTLFAKAPRHKRHIDTVACFRLFFFNPSLISIDLNRTSSMGLTLLHFCLISARVIFAIFKN